MSAENTCTAVVADPDKPGRMYRCDRAAHSGPHHTRNERGEERTWGNAAGKNETPRPAESMVDAYTEHARALRAYRDDASPSNAERIRKALDVVTTEEARYAADCIAAGVPPVAKPLPLEGINS